MLTAFSILRRLPDSSAESRSVWLCFSIPPPPSNSGHFSCSFTDQSTLICSGGRSKCDSRFENFLTFGEPKLQRCQTSVFEGSGSCPCGNFRDESIEFIKSQFVAELGYLGPKKKSMFEEKFASFRAVCVPDQSVLGPSFSPTHFRGLNKEKRENLPLWIHTKQWECNQLNVDVCVLVFFFN